MLTTKQTETIKHIAKTLEANHPEISRQLLAALEEAAKPKVILNLHGRRPLMWSDQRKA